MGNGGKKAATNTLFTCNQRMYVCVKDAIAFSMHATLQMLNFQMAECSGNCLKTKHFRILR